jgi:hypothetical protein
VELEGGLVELQRILNLDLLGVVDFVFRFVVGLDVERLEV